MHILLGCHAAADVCVSPHCWCLCFPALLVFVFPCSAGVCVSLHCWSHCIPSQLKSVETSNALVYGNIFSDYARWFRELDPNFSGIIDRAAIQRYLDAPGDSQADDKLDVFTSVARRCVCCPCMRCPCMR